MMRANPGLVAVLTASTAVLLAACGGQPPRTIPDQPAAPTSAVAPAPTSAKPKPARPNWTLKRGGGYYKDDGPGDNPPEDIDAIPDAVPRLEPLHRFANNPYTVLGRDYVPQRTLAPVRMQGVASWYGRKFHGQKTSSGEPYDMYGMTAAHPTLPIPSYVRVTNPANGKSVTVRVNDRGPFHANRIIDLSYSAAWKLGYIGEGSTLVDVESVFPADSALASATALSPSASNAPVREAAVSRLIADPEPRALALSRDSRGHFLQLGAFGNRDNAEALRAHLARELGEADDRIRIQTSGPLHRVQLGPFADASQARAAGERLRENFGMKPVVVQR